MIRLYFIKNISEMDMPYFQQASDMATFMANHYVGDAHSFEDSYYPPYLRNSIKVSKSADFDYENGSANYLSLESEEGYTYFYFIDYINYISPDVYSIEVHMDTIMTYYWNIRVAGFMVERAFINRWGSKNTPAINRDYIRENFSNGNYKVTDNYIIDGQTNNRWIVIGILNRTKIENSGLSPISQIYASMINSWSEPLKQVLIDQQGNYLNNSQVSKVSGYMLFSFANARCTGTYNYPSTMTEAHYFYPAYDYDDEIDGWTSGTQHIDGGELNNPINQLITDPNLRDIFVIPFIPFSKDVSITLRQPTSPGYTAYDVNFDEEYINFGGQSSSGFDDDRRLYRYGFVRGIVPPDNIGALGAKQTPYKQLRVVVKNNSYEPFSLMKNTNPANVFDKMYCPQLLDTNYVQVTFGSLYSNTTYPVEYLTTSYIYGKYYADCFTGKRYYYLTKGATDYFDEYCTIVCDDNILTIDMLNDPWKEYEANNRSRWATIGVGAGINAIKDLIGVASIAGGMSAIKDTANLEKYIYSTQISNRKKSKNNDILKARIALTEVGKNEDIRASQMGMLKSGIGILDSATAITSQLEREHNLQQAPLSVTRGGSDSSVVNSMAWAIRWVTRTCENIEQVAQIYHRIGYNVKRYYNGEAWSFLELLMDLRNRYYFNIVQLGECSIFIEGKMQNEDITLDIKRRLQQGIRYWNTEVNDFELCNFYYDNVELDYL